MSSWILGERRGPEWKQGWGWRALSSSSLPPAPLLAVFVIVVILMSLSGYVDYRAQARRTTLGLQLVLLLLPIALVVVAGCVLRDWRVALMDRSPGAPHRVVATDQGGASPWGVAALVAVLLLLVWYQSYFHSQWFPGLSRGG